MTKLWITRVTGAIVGIHAQAKKPLMLHNRLVYKYGQFTRYICVPAFRRAFGYTPPRNSCEQITITVEVEMKTGRSKENVKRLKIASRNIRRGKRTRHKLKRRR